MNNLRLVSELDTSDDAVNIRQTAHYCRSRMTTANVAAAWLSIGQQLHGLRGTLKKKTPRGDNQHIGWREAFKQKQSNGNAEFPFKRQTADRYIKVHLFFEALGGAAKIFAQLPSSFHALEAMMKTKMKREDIEARILDGSISPFTDAAHIRAFKNTIGIMRKPRASKKQRIASVFKLLAKLDLTLDDLNQAAGE